MSNTKKTDKAYAANLDLSIGKALDAIVEEKDHWCEARDTFWQILEEGNPLEKALEVALDCAADESTQWCEGERIFNVTLDALSTPEQKMPIKKALHPERIYRIFFPKRSH